MKEGFQERGLEKSSMKRKWEYGIGRVKWGARWEGKVEEGVWGRITVTKDLWKSHMETSSMEAS